MEGSLSNQCFHTWQQTAKRILLPGSGTFGATAQLSPVEGSRDAIREPRAGEELEEFWNDWGIGESIETIETD